MSNAPTPHRGCDVLVNRDVCMQFARKAIGHRHGGRPMSPAQNATFSYYSQPITLVVTPGVTATGAVPTTVLEVAMDAAFASVVTTQTLPPAVNGQATATLNHLSAATTYYWRVKTTAGDNPSILSATSTFSIGPLLVIQPPTPVTPLGDTFPHKR